MCKPRYRRTSKTQPYVPEDRRNVASNSVRGRIFHESVQSCKLLSFSPNPMPIAVFYRNFAQFTPSSAMADSKPLFLYDHPASSYAQKIRIALREKDIPFTTKVPDAITKGTPEADLITANPRLEVPTLIDGDVEIFDSTIILEYIEEKWPMPPLMPKGPAERARARMVEEICDTHYEAVNWGYAELLWFGRADYDFELKASMEEKATEQTRACIDWLTEKLGDSPFFNGEVFGWADVCAAAIVNRTRYYGIALVEGEAMEKWLKRVSERASVKETFKEAEAAFKSIAKMRDAYTSGERKREYRDHRLEWMIKSGGMEIVKDGIEKNNVRFPWP